MTEVLRQGDPRWSKHKLGAGSSTFGAAGCVLFAIDNARHRLTGHVLDPMGLNDEGVKAECFSGSSAFIERLAAHAGLVAGPRVELDVTIMSQMIQSYLASGRLVLAFVDHDSALRGGDPVGEHWILLHKQAGQTYLYDDSATGAMGGLVVSTLSAPSGWSDHRVYQVRAFRTLRAG